MTMEQAEFEVFETLVNEVDNHRERECQPYLIHAAHFLLPDSPAQVEAIHEERNFFGRTDLVLSADVRDDVNQVSRHAYIWELKSPQCYLFEMDTQNRSRPTKEFLQAENQLLHYFHEANGNERFRERMKVMSQDNIHVGGIIIGTSARRIRNAGDLEKAETARKVREKYLYNGHSIRIITWDRILDFVRPS